MRVSGIFTATTVSPSPTLRQRPSCYTIRAGRNLPDKEFRYLRLACYTRRQTFRRGERRSPFWKLGRGFRHFCGILHIAKEVGLYLEMILNHPSGM